MAVTGKLYVSSFLSAYNAEMKLGTDTVKAMLCSSASNATTATLRYKSEVTGEITGTNYTAGGAALQSAAATVSGNVFKFDADDTAWADSTLIARFLVLYVEKGSSATSPLIGYVDFGADVSTTSGTFQSIWNSNGIFTVTV